MQRNHEKLIYHGQGGDEEIFDFEGCNISIYDWATGKQLVALPYDVGIKFVAESRPIAGDGMQNVRTVPSRVAAQINGLACRNVVHEETRLFFISQSKPWVRP